MVGLLLVCFKLFTNFGKETMLLKNGIYKSYYIFTLQTMLISSLTLKIVYKYPIKYWDQS